MNSQSKSVQRFFQFDHSASVARATVVCLVAALFPISVVVGQGNASDKEKLNSELSDTVRTGSDKDNNPDEKSDAIASDEGSEITQDQVDQLIEQLDADRLAERDAAEEKLMEFGTAVLPMLPQDTRSMGAEAVVRLQRLTRVLRERQIASFVEPTYVTLVGTMSVEAAISEIIDQTGNQIAMGNMDLSAEIDLQIENELFWKALDQVLDASSLTVQAYGGDEHTLALAPANEYTPKRVDSASYAGVLRLQPINLTTTTSLGNLDGSTTKLLSRVRWEPRLSPVYFRFPMADVAGVTDIDSELTSTVMNSSPEYSPQGYNTQIEFEITLPTPPRESTEISELSGRMVAALPSQEVSLGFAQLDRPGKKSESVGNLTVTIESVRPNSKLYELRVLVALEKAGQTLESFRSWFLNNDAYLIDQNDTRVEHLGFNTYKLGETEIGVSYLFSMPEGIENYEFKYDAPGGVTEREYSYEFRDIPLR